MTHPHPHHAHGAADPSLARMLDLDARILHGHQRELTAWVRRLARDTAGRVVVDLGAGTGTGTVALARRFDRAEVHAVDASAAMLARVAERAVVDGLADRIRTVHADLDAGWPALPPADLVWASLMLHEVADPARLLARVHDALAPGGLLAVVEMDGAPRFLPDDLHPDLVRPGLADRLDDAATHGGTGGPSHPDWAPWLRDAGLVDVATRVFRIEPDPADPIAAAATLPYARAWLARVRDRSADRLDAGDRAALDALLDDDGPHALARIPGVALRGTRTAYVGRRPR
ncbi:SAM-dependent methyltransferase [Clavibacter michiganensis]|uniref:class I SAM-dependent methyltransferase n=1 Tax=Clavibacter michiganensis TaxID=28447 RepID=UPI001AEB09D2|nr:class I SAM-dependent methyltransferase [Clavibacter michiganensis]MBP2457919.1 SAM-dependent methyltransferase [Clavibacter michiganensis]MDQ0410489.1 SAM-dependent methyltransferase [Clavibacter michiganensis]